MMDVSGLMSIVLRTDDRIQIHISDFQIQMAQTLFLRDMMMDVSELVRMHSYFSLIFGWLKLCIR